MLTRHYLLLTLDLTCFKLNTIFSTYEIINNNAAYIDLRETNLPSINK